MAEGGEIGEGGGGEVPKHATRTDRIAQWSKSNYEAKRYSWTRWETNAQGLLHLSVMQRCLIMCLNRDTRMFTGTRKPSSCYQHIRTIWTEMQVVAILLHDTWRDAQWFEIASSSSTKIRKSLLERFDNDASLVFFLYLSLSNDRIYLYICSCISLKKLKR